MNRLERKVRWTRKGLCLILTLMVVLVSALPAQTQVDASSVSQETYPFETEMLPPEALTLDGNNLVAPEGNEYEKLDSALAAIADAALVSSARGLEEAENQLVQVVDNRVQVQITTTSEGVERSVQAIEQAGGEITSVTQKKDYIQAWLPASELIRLSEDQDILYIRKPAEVILFESQQVGASTTEGLAAMNGVAWHNNGYKGAGVKVAIIDGGFQGYSTLLGSDLPASVTIKNFVDYETDSQVNGTTQHGTACAEVIHDIAPNASLYLIKIATNLDLEEAVNWLISSQSVDIISTSLGWYNITPGDGTGFFADLVQEATNSGILWLTAAGNDREAHWGGLYNDSDSDGFHNFNGSDEINYFGPGDGSAYLIPAGYRIQAFLRWSDWTTVNQNLTLWLVRWDGSTWFVVATGGDYQNGQAGQTPTEFVSYVTSGSTTKYALVVVGSSVNRSINLDLFVPKFVPMDNLVYARSLSNLADSPAAMTVAALDSTSPYPQESYSSEGPANGSGGILTGGAIKPDISAYANVATQSYTGSTFNGTSSATPHVAGAAALVLSAYPTYTPGQLRAFLQGRAVDMGSSGKDTLFGYGRLTLGTPPAAIPTITVTSITPDNDVDFGAANVTIRGTNFKAGAIPKLTRAGQADITATNIKVVDATTITCSFALSGAENGLWNVVVSAPSSQPGQLTNGFTVYAYTGSLYQLFVPLVLK